MAGLESPERVTGGFCFLAAATSEAYGAHDGATAGCVTVNSFVFASSCVTA